ncbi:MAG: VOC family protein, partial [Rhodospirillales bacterium]|nr:VOC family protein [Rhodospirillales bacterium]
KALLEKAGVAITEGPITFDDGATAIFVRDPDRNVIEFNQKAGTAA